MELADEVYGLSKPKEIAQRVLRKACEFYDADWCGIFDADMMLRLWMPFWWYNRVTGGMTKTRTDMDQYGILGELPRWRNAIEQNTPMIIKDVDTLKEAIPEEYNIFIQQQVTSIIMLFVLSLKYASVSAHSRGCCLEHTFQIDALNCSALPKFFSWYYGFC